MIPNNCYLKKGNSEMEAYMREFFTEEQERTAIRNGTIKERIRLILSAQKKGKSNKDIADFLDIPEEEVEKTIKEAKI